MSTREIKNIFAALTNHAIKQFSNLAIMQSSNTQVVNQFAVRLNWQTIEQRMNCNSNFLIFLRIFLFKTTCIYFDLLYLVVL